MSVRTCGVLFAVLLIGGCGDDGASPDASPPDASDDARIDAAPMPDASDDASADAEPDGAMDAMPDGMLDATPDATPDADHPDPMPGDCIDPPAPSDRTGAFSCEMCRPPGRGVPAGIPGDCSADADCTAGDNGQCVAGRFAFCSYDECFSDADCAADELCACDGARGGGNACITAGCHTSADCGAGHACAPSLGSCGNYTPPVGYWCHSDADSCTVDADCTAAGMGPGPGYCAYIREVGHWECRYSHCVG